jgi:tRNA A37 N6-isopentenylltransferase MiaA
MPRSANCDSVITGARYSAVLSAYDLTDCGTTAEAAALSVRDTRRYAKRQFTWMAHQAGAFLPVAAEGLDERVAVVRRALQG